MHILKLKYFYAFGIFLVLLNLSYAVDSVSQHNIPENITILIENGKQNSAVVLINQTIKKKKISLNNTRKMDVLKYTSLYDEIAELMILENELLSNLEKTDDIDTDQICNFILDYEEVEFVKTQFYKTPFHDDVAKTVQNIASLYELCHPPMAGKYLKSVLKIKENIYGKESAEAANAYDKLGDHHHFSMAEFKSAIEYYEKAKVIREILYKKDDAQVTKNYARLAIVIFYYKSDKVKAEQLILKSLKIRNSDKNANSVFIYQALIDSAYFYDLTGNYKKSLGYLKEAEKLLQKVGKKNSPEMVDVYKSISTLYLNMNDEKMSQVYYQRASLIKIKTSSSKK